MRKVLDSKKSLWILGIARGHNSGVCLLKDGEIVFSLEEERLSRNKYDGSPFATMCKVLEYTDKLDYIVAAHTQPLQDAPTTEYSGDNIYVALARKLGLIDNKIYKYGNYTQEHPQVIDYSYMHHKLHACCAFYRSGFKEATAVVVDGAGTFIPLSMGRETITGWEVESLFTCSYPDNFNTLYKHIGVRGNTISVVTKQPILTPDVEHDPNPIEMVVTERGGAVKAYEAVTEYCGFTAIEAGKTMGLFPYGKPNDKIPKIFDNSATLPLVNRNLITPNYPQGAIVNFPIYEYLQNSNAEDVTTLQNRRDLAYAVQTETQQEVLRLILKAVDMSGIKNVVLSGGYGLNCVANYYYLTELNKHGIKLYVEPISNDAGTAIGAALYHHRTITGDMQVYGNSTVYLGPKLEYSQEEIYALADKYQAEVSMTTKEDVVDLMTNKNIVAMFQGRSENGPRALGNRSLMFDPTFKDGKDFVNRIKRREYFRPFAGSILEDDVHDWFDLRGMENSPYMMYAVNCKPGVEEKIPAIIHVDGTCRIQTVRREDNQHYYDVIKAFKNKTGIPIIFNTSFNLGGEPLVESLDDALRTLSKTGIDYLYLPEYNMLITVKIKQE